MKVAVINLDLIPEFVDIVIGDFVYELQLRVEKQGDENNPLPINMDEQPKEDGDKDKETNPEEADKESLKDLIVRNIGIFGHILIKKLNM